ncbi:MAG: DUF1588 domain-containing protein [Nannocystaceae bacterium]|nr:DUF1588 domain-containing protein [bacterium]
MRRAAWMLASSLATGCYAGGEAGLDTDAASETDTMGSADGSSGPSSGDGDGDGGDGHGEPAERCESSKIGPPLLRRLTQAEFDATVRTVFPAIAGTFDAVSVGADTTSALGFRNDAGTLVVGEQTAAEILATAEDVGDAITDPGVFASVLPCSSEAPDEGCARTFAQEYGARLFRRSLTQGELDRYVALYASVSGQSDFGTGIKWMLVSLFQSPHVVYRSELGEDAGDGTRTLTGWELATALAYDYSGAPPSDTLRTLGEQGGLAEPQARVEQARMLLSTEAGRQSVHRFFEDWIDYPEVALKTRPDTPEFDAVRSALAQETRRFIDTVILEDEGDVQSLLLADYTSLDAELAAYYGWGEVSGEPEVVPRPEAWGVGLLAQGSVLAANAQIDASSPTQRGLLVYERLLCKEPPPVPEDIPAIEPPDPGVSTTRQRYEESHMANPGCRSCHAFFDPIGFSFEHFDPAGRYRADEAGLTIDASGSIPVGVLDEEVTFDGLTDLSQTLAALPEVTDCVSGLTAAYVFGGAGGQSCLAEEARTALGEGEISMVEFLAQLAAAPHFTTREP